MPDPATLGLFMVAAMAILLIPGPTVLFVVTCSLNHGRWVGLVSVLGVEMGGLLHVMAATAGLSALLVSFSVLFGVVKGLGAAYLMYLGVQTLLDGTTSPGQASFAPPTLRRVSWQGALIDALEHLTEKMHHPE